MNTITEHRRDHLLGRRPPRTSNDYSPNIQHLCITFRALVFVFTTFLASICIRSEVNSIIREIPFVKIEPGFHKNGTQNL